MYTYYNLIIIHFMYSDRIGMMMSYYILKLLERTTIIKFWLRIKLSEMLRLLNEQYKQKLSNKRLVPTEIENKVPRKKTFLTYEYNAI